MNHYEILLSMQNEISFLFPAPTAANNPPSVLYFTLPDDDQGSQNVLQ